jgi:hypothetical protein
VGSFQYNGAISGSILNTPLGDARFYEHNGQITLASDGGQGVVTRGSDSILLAASASNHSITAYAVSSNGTLSPASTLGAEQFLPIATPQDMATVSFQEQSYLVLASVGIGSLTVLTLDFLGILSPVDQVIDSLNTRFLGAQILETFTHQGLCLCHCGWARQRPVIAPVFG